MVEDRIRYKKVEAAVKKVEDADLKRGDKVVFENKTYDFSYVGGGEKVVIHEEGEYNMQDSLAVNFEDLEIINKNKIDN